MFARREGQHADSGYLSETMFFKADTKNRIQNKRINGSEPPDSHT